MILEIYDSMKGNRQEEKKKLSKKERVERFDSEKWIAALSIYWWEIKVTMLSNNTDSLHYLLPQGHEGTGKQREKLPQISL